MLTIVFIAKDTVQLYSDFIIQRQYNNKEPFTKGVVLVLTKRGIRILKSLTIV